MGNIKKLKQYFIQSKVTDFKEEKISSSKDASNYIRKFFEHDIDVFESFFILLLNRNNIAVGYAKISSGGIAGTVVDPIIVAKYCIDTLSTNVILCHNHPSGNLNPSEQDKQITKVLKDTLGLFKCNIADHIILTPKSYFSFTDEGLL